MNTRSFIAEVKQRRALWDQSSRHYHNKRALGDGWREIASMFDVEVITAKQKWKNLRDTFRIELKKTKRYNLSSADPHPSLWAYYEDMYFLKDILRTRTLKDFPDAPPTDVTEACIEKVKVEEDAEMTFSPAPLLEDDGEHKSNIRIENVTSLQAQSNDADTTIKKVWLKDERDEEDQDDDLLFFRSLLPFVKKLDQDKRLLFRMNVQQMLYNQLYSNN